MADVDYYVGIDLGTGGASVVFVDPYSKALAKGGFGIPMHLGHHGEHEQLVDDWRQAIRIAFAEAYQSARGNGVQLGTCLAVCPSGQMHGECLRMDDGTWRPRVRLWCDERNDAESQELSGLFAGVAPMPTRLTSTRWLWTTRHEPEDAKRCIGITVPSGVLASFLDANILTIGIGEASGMFPIGSELGYHPVLASMFDGLTRETGVKPILELLPPPVTVGTTVGYLDTAGHELTGLPIGTRIVASEGDQQTTLAGCYVADKGVTALSGGTSCCFNTVTSVPYSGHHLGIEPFMATDGQGFLMCHSANGTQFNNTVAKLCGGSDDDSLAVMMAEALEAPLDCGGILVLPLAKAEHGLGFPEKSRSSIHGLTFENATRGNLLRASVVGSMFVLRFSFDVLRKMGVQSDKIVASGGMVKTPNTGQVVADTFNERVEILGSGDEGSAYGAALMAAYGDIVVQCPDLTWSQFLDSRRPEPEHVFQPNPKAVATYDRMYETFLRVLRDVQHPLVEVDWFV